MAPDPFGQNRPQRLLLNQINLKTAIQAHVAPSTDTEKTLAAIWAEVLQRDQIGIRDNFFEIGGHSLLATQILTRMQRALPEAVSLQMIFQSPTIEAIGQAIDSIRSSTHADRLSAVEGDEDREIMEF